MVNCKISMSISLSDLILSKIWRIVSINLNLFKKKEREHFSLCLFRLHQLLQFGCSENFSIRVLGGYVTLTVWSSFDLLSLQHSGQCLRKYKSSRLDLAQVDLNSFSLCLFRRCLIPGIRYIIKHDNLIYPVNSFASREGLVRKALVSTC